MAYEVGHVTWIHGVSGSGKSMLIKAIASHYPPERLHFLTDDEHGVVDMHSVIHRKQEKGVEHLVVIHLHRDQPQMPLLKWENGAAEKSTFADLRIVFTATRAPDRNHPRINCIHLQRPAHLQPTFSYEVVLV